MKESRENLADEQLDALLGALFRRLLGPDARRAAPPISQMEDGYPGASEPRRRLLPISEDLRSPEHMIDALAAKLAGLLEQKVKPSPIPLSIALWDMATIATYLQRDPDSVRERIACLPDFPRAIRLPSATKRGMHPLYKAAEVIAWVQKFQDSAPGRMGRPRKPT